jgi:hypothetical protein
MAFAGEVEAFPAVAVNDNLGKDLYGEDIKQFFR